MQTPTDGFSFHIIKSLLHAFEPCSEFKQDLIFLYTYKYHSLLNTLSGNKLVTCDHYLQKMHHIHTGIPGLIEATGMNKIILVIISRITYFGHLQGKHQMKCDQLVLSKSSLVLHAHQLL